MDVIALHRDQARREFFPAAPPIFFDPVIKAFVVTGPRQCEAILASPHVGVSPYRPAYEDMAERNPDFAFPHMLFAFKYIPMCLNGEEHRLARRRIAEFLGSRKPVAAAAAPGIVDRWLGALEVDGRIELMGEAIEPMVKEFLGTLNGTDAAALVQGAPAVFDRMMSAKRRRKLDDELGAIRAHIRRTLGPDAGEDEEGIRLALFVLGHDALAGGFGESLYQLLRANPGRPLSEIDYPAVQPETSIPFVERIVMVPFEYEGVAFSKGNRIRVMLQSFSYSRHEIDRTRIFGAGLHACVGRQISLDLWSEFVRRLKRIATRLEIVDYALRREDYVFTYPSKLVVEVGR
jgi:hypothetical protein